ncbi:MAG: hypothetical protein Q7K42_01075 [Candidatus Diapherotrites archaeon]|nr:hypothetical protein [Candidatus Diapherotrites archaeon]
MPINYPPNSPMGFGPNLQYDEPRESPLDTVKQLWEEKGKPFIEQNWKKILAGIVVLVLAFFVYDFFIGSVKQVSIQLQDTEGQPALVSGSVFGQDNNPILQFSNGLISGSLRKGQYFVRLSDRGEFKDEILQLPISESTPAVLQLEKDYKIDILNFLFPNNLSVGEKASFSFFAKNKGDKLANVEFDLKSAGDLFEDVVFEPSSVSLSPNGQEQVKLSFKVKTPSKIPSKDGEKKDAKLLVKGLKETNSANKKAQFTLYPAVSLTITPDKIDFGTVKAGEKSKDKELLIVNKSNYDLKGVKISFDVYSKSNNEDKDIISWFIWSIKGCADSGDCLLDIDKPQNASDKIRSLLFLILPSDAKTGSVRANLNIEKGSFTESIPISFEIEGAKTQLDVKLSNVDFKLKKNDIGEYVEQKASLTISNLGDVALTNIDPLIDCAQDYVYILQAKSGQIPFDLESKTSSDNKRVFDLIVKAPNSEDPGNVQSCTIAVSYDDSLSGETKTLPPVFFKITTSD